jgi:hypothetical protein
MRKRMSVIKPDSHAITSIYYSPPLRTAIREILNDINWRTIDVTRIGKNPSKEMDEVLVAAGRKHCGTLRQQQNAAATASTVKRTRLSPLSSLLRTSPVIGTTQPRPLNRRRRGVTSRYFAQLKNQICASLGNLFSSRGLVYM